jgi:hypothetical protein
MISFSFMICSLGCADDRRRICDSICAASAKQQTMYRRRAYASDEAVVVWFALPVVANAFQASDKLTLRPSNVTHRGFDSGPQVCGYAFADLAQFCRSHPVPVPGVLFFHEKRPAVAPAKKIACEVGAGVRGIDELSLTCPTGSLRRTLNLQSYHRRYQR